jgi:formate dehydrogenase subunit gamma
MPSPAPFDTAHAGRLIEERRHIPGALLPILHALQETFGYVDREAVPLLAKALNLSRAEVHGVISFYHDFRDHPPGRHVVRVCRAEACQSMNNEALIAHAKRRLGVDFHGTTSDGRFTLEAVYCLGNCACAPAITIDDKVHGRVDPARLDALLDAAGKQP